MTRRLATIAIISASLLSSLLPMVVAADTALPLPVKMAAVGDSITQAASSAGTLGADAPQNSWSTGTNATVNSHYLRLLGLGASLSGENHNLSVSGAKVAGLNAQMQNVVALKPDYLTVLIGGNDLCTDTVAEMTSVTDFQAQFETAMSTLAAGSPSTRVYLISLPDAYQLWNLFKGNFWARFIWSAGNICQSLLANPTSTQQADVQRRATVRQRNIDYNSALASVCATFANCRFDNDAVFNTQFTTADVSGDYFHPSVAGQAKLALVTWSVGYTWATTPPNVAPTASFTTNCAGLSCAFTDGSTDSDGTIVTRTWTFGDSTSSTATNPSHTYASAGTYIVVLTVSDDDGATGSSSASVTVGTTTASMWVGGLTSTTTSARNSWGATVAIRVVDTSGPVSGVSVVGVWSAGTGPASCVTDTNGSCSVTTSTLNKKTPSVSFTVSGLTKTGWAYDPTRNVLTSIIVAKP